MGIYVFKKSVLQELLKSSNHDFGKHIIPEALGERRVYSFQFTHYWEDIGTIGSFFTANLEMASDHPSLDLFNPDWIIYTRPRYLASSLINGCEIHHSMITEGCRLENARIDNASIGIRSIVKPGAHLRNVVMMGADYYDKKKADGGRIPVGVGENSSIERAILDKNVRIGKNVQIHDHSQDPDGDFEKYYIRDGVVVVPKSAVIPDGMVI
jgi:glucose-1-phosphate adenylyltransferase